VDENLEDLREEFLKNGGHEITDAITVIKFMLSMVIQGESMLIKLKLPERRKDKDCHCLVGEGCGCEVFDYNKALDDVESLNQPLVRGMEIDVDSLAYELCKMFADDFYVETPQHFKDMANNLKANAHVWLKEVEKGK